MRSLFERYLLPGLVFQSIILAGGYGTGRELVQFFLQFGPIPGFLGMAVSTLTVSLTAAASFEYARVLSAYDYRRFFIHLLGRFWFLYEIGYLLAVILIQAVIFAASGTVLEETFGIPWAVGTGGMVAAVGVLVFFGTGAIERFLASWSMVLYATYLFFLAWSLDAFGGDITRGLASDDAQPGWFLSGFLYGALQVSLIPAVLFTVRHTETRRQAVGAGLLAGVIAILPAVFFYIAMVGHYPEIIDRPVPANYLLEALGARWFQIAFQVVLFGTLIETGAGLVHAFNERLDGVLRDRQAGTQRGLSPRRRVLIAVALIAIGASLSQFGITAIIAQGYTAVVWVFVLVYVIPILLWGARQALSHR